MYFFFYLLRVTRTKLVELENKENLISPKTWWNLLSFGVQLPNCMVLELTGKNVSSLKNSAREDIGFGLRLHFSGQRLMQWLWSTIIFPNILRSRCQFENIFNPHK